MPSFSLEVEYAKSNRSSCKQCKCKIEKDAIRIGIKAAAPEVDEGEDAGSRQASHVLEAVKWHHAGCISNTRKPAWFKKHFPGEARETIGNFGALKEEDQNTVDLILKACRGECPLPEAAVRTAVEAIPTPVKAAAKRKGRATAEESEEQPPAKIAKTTLSSEQLEAIQAVKVALAGKNVAALGALLAKNGLPKSGKKDELLDRVAECKALGVPPSCPSCEKVKLRFSRDTGKFSCPGYFDDEKKAFQRCKGPGADADPQRTPWQELA